MAGRISQPFFMIDIPLDKSKAVRIKARVNEKSVPQVFTFKNSDGSAHEITDYDFKLYVQKRANSNVKLFTLAIGSGLTIQGAGNNQLLIEVTALQATQQADSYFWRLYSADQDHTWLNGPWEFHNGEFNSIDEEDDIIINENGTNITIEITSIAAAGALGFNIRSDFDASGNVFPDSPTGSGPSGVIKRFDAYPITTGGFLDFGNGPEEVPAQSILVAWTDNPTNGTHWRLF